MKTKYYSWKLNKSGLESSKSKKITKRNRKMFVNNIKNVLISSMKRCRKR